MKKDKNQFRLPWIKYWDEIMIDPIIMDKCIPGYIDKRIKELKKEEKMLTNTGVANSKLGRHAR